MELTRKEIIDGLLGIHAVTCNYKGDQVILHSMPMPKLTAILSGAAELLKAETPRVMTPNEVMDYVGYYEKNPPNEAQKLPLWTESKESTGVFSGYRNVGNIRNLINMSGLDKSYLFGVDWRCWTSEPSKKQMEATPWS